MTKDQIKQMQKLIQDNIDYRQHCWDRAMTFSSDPKTNQYYQDRYYETTEVLNGQLSIYAIATNQNKLELQSKINYNEEWK